MSLASDAFEPRLVAGEKTLWTGHPKQGLLFTPRDILLIPFSILWCGFAVFWELSALGMMGFGAHRITHSQPPIFFPVFGFAFVLVGLFMVFGRFILDIVLRQNTSYAVTNQRILIFRRWPAQKFVALALDRLPALVLTEGQQSRGTIAFGESGPMFGRYGFSWVPSLSPVPSFLEIENASAIFDLIQRQVRSGRG